MTLFTMSRNELTCLRVLIDIAGGRLSVANATRLIWLAEDRPVTYGLLNASERAVRTV